MWQTISEMTVTICLHFLMGICYRLFLCLCYRTYLSCEDESSLIFQESTVTCHNGYRQKWLLAWRLQCHIQHLEREREREGGREGADSLFVLQRTDSHSAGIHVLFTNCFVCRWFCVVHNLKPPLHSHSWLSFGKFQDTEPFLNHCERHFSSRLPPSGGTWKYAKASSTKKKTWRDSLPIDMLLSAVSVLVVAQSSLEIPEGLMNNPVY